MLKSEQSLFDMLSAVIGACLMGFLFLFCFLASFVKTAYVTELGITNKHRTQAGYTCTFSTKRTNITLVS